MKTNININGYARNILAPEKNTELVPSLTLDTENEKTIREKRIKTVKNSGILFFLHNCVLITTNKKSDIQPARHNMGVTKLK
jgi:hypothetical protein